MKKLITLAIFPFLTLKWIALQFLQQAVIAVNKKTHLSHSPLLALPSLALSTSAAAVRALRSVPPAAAPAQTTEFAPRA